MKINTSNTPLIEQKKDALIIFCAEDRLLLPETEQPLKTLLQEILTASAFKGEAGQVSIFPALGKVSAQQIILAGIGAPKHFYNGLLEQAAAAATRAGQHAGLKSYATALATACPAMRSDTFATLVTRGAGWGTYTFSRFKKEPTPAKPISLSFVGSIKPRTTLTNAAEQALALQNTADLANLPGNAATPQKIADWARTMAAENNLGFEELTQEQLSERGFGGILAVGQGSKQDSRMIILKHDGTDPAAAPLILVGKTVTFDSGGLSLKPGKGMGWMRYDKCGGMAVLTAMQMIARMKLPTSVIAILGVAENMPGANAIRPGDIITSYSGKTIEVLNTDAEGRLILADALALAAEMNPAAIVDVATLTGAVITALGRTVSAILGNEQTLIDQLLASGTASGERLWQLPLWKDYSDEMTSDFADISNLGKNGVAGTATAAAFLQEFVPEEIPWAHLDIAGTAWLEAAKPHQAAGATLFGARLLTEWVQGRH